VICTPGGVTMRWQLPGRWAGAKASGFLRRRSGHAAGADASYAAEVATPPVLITFDLL
jgi:hypothetical protein